MTKTNKLPKWKKGKGNNSFPKFEKVNVPKFKKVKL